MRRVGPSSFVPLDRRDGEASLIPCDVVGCGEFGEAGWKDQVVIRFLNNGVDVAATAYCTFSEVSCAVGDN